MLEMAEDEPDPILDSSVLRLDDSLDNGVSDESVVEREALEGKSEFERVVEDSG